MSTLSLRHTNSFNGGNVFPLFPPPSTVAFLPTFFFLFVRGAARALRKWAIKERLQLSRFDIQCWVVFTSGLVFMSHVVYRLLFFVSGKCFLLEWFLHFWRCEGEIFFSRISRGFRWFWELSIGGKIVSGSDKGVYVVCFLKINFLAIEFKMS